MNQFLSIGLLRAAVFASVALSMVACFFYYSSRDDKVPFGSRTFFTVSAIDSHLTKADAVGVITHLADTYRINLVKVAVDPQSRDFSRLLVAFVGNKTALLQNWPKGEYPAFDSSRATRVASSRELGVTDLRGAYESDAQPRQIHAIVAALTAAGVVAQVEQVTTSQLLAPLTASPLMAALLGMLATLVVVIAYSVTHRQKVYAVKGLYGQSVARIFLSELRLIAIIFTASAVVLVVPGIALLGLYNQFRQAGPFMLLVAEVLSIHGAFLIVILTCAFASSRADDTVAILKGRRALRTLAIFSVVAQTMALVLIFLVASSTVKLALETQSTQGFARSWESARQDVTVEFTARTESEFKSVMPGFGALAREADARGKMVLAYQPATPPGEVRGVGPESGNSLIVNSQFLHEQVLLADDGHRIVPAEIPAGHILLLVPERLKSSIGAISTEYRAWAAFQRSLDGSIPEPTVTVSTIGTKDGQQIFNYGGTYARPQISQKDPVVAVVSTAPGILSDDFLLSAASSGNILFTDPAQLNAEIQSSGLTDDIRSVDRASEQALSYLADRTSTLRATVLVLIFALLVLLFSNAILASVYCDRFKQAIFQKYAHGFPFIRTHGAFLATLLVWSVAIVAVTASSVSGMTFTVAVSIVLVNLGCGVVFAMVFQRRFRGDFVKRY